MNHEPVKNNFRESEVLTSDERQLSALLGGLKRVEAPKDFDFKLKAKIAAGAPADARKSFLFPALRYVLPLCLVIVLTAFAALRILAPGEESSAPAIAEISPTQNIQEKILVPAVNPTADAAANSAPPEIAKAPKTTVAGNKNSIAAPSGNPGAKIEPKANGDFNVRDSALTKASPINLNPNARNPNTGESAEIPIREVLKTLGIEVEFSGINCKVTAVREGTSARIANFQPGDVIEAIDNKKLSSATTFSESFKAKTFRVVRAGKPMVIDLTKR